MAMGNHHTHSDSIVSYLIGAWGLMLSLSDDLEVITLLISLAILVVRLLYDAFRLWRYITRR
jgi:hypothetical protein